MNLVFWVLLIVSLPMTSVTYAATPDARRFAIALGNNQGLPAEAP